MNSLLRPAVNRDRQNTSQTSLLKVSISVSQNTPSPYIMKMAASRARTRSFKIDGPSPIWWKGFYERNPRIKKVTGRGIASERSDRLTHELFDPFFELLTELKEVSPTKQPSNAHIPIQKHPSCWANPV